jgi:3-isopropylmalate/(R)-2-methylmalate dehydratase large subunit
MIPVTVPKTVRVWVEGDARGLLSPKDLVLHLIGDPFFREEQWRESPTDTCVIQLGGPGLDQWNVDELSVITNMTVEGGLMTGIVEPCAPIREFLQANRGQDYAERLVEPDADASYVKTIPWARGCHAQLPRAARRHGPMPFARRHHAALLSASVWPWETL